MSTIDLTDETTLLEIERRHKRPGGFETACQNCRYWQLRYKSDEDQLTRDNAAGPWSDVVGECRRHAPIAMATLLSHIGRMMGAAAWALEEMANIEHDKNENYHFEGQDEGEIHEWPMTNANDWCGEFSKR